MKELHVDVAIIGGGPAGLAAAIEAHDGGAEKVLILERDLDLGGILQQCIHDGFGLHRFGQRLSGTEYAQRYVDMVAEREIMVKLDTMVIELTDDRTIYAINPKDGMMRIQCKAVILAMGCRERTASQVFIYGTRPAGVLTAGAVQRYINIEEYLPGKRAVILGSGDIGLIMARRMTLEGVHVEGVFEAMPNPGGLTRNIVQCLHDYNIPLHLSTTVVRVHGKKRIEGVTVAKVGSDFRAIEGTEQFIPCDLLVLAVGLIPENELSRGAKVEMDPKTKGPVLDNNMMTSVPGIFAAGNVAVVFDLVDYVSASGVTAARGALKFIRGELKENPAYWAVMAGENVNFVVPQRVRGDASEETNFYLRVKRPLTKVQLLCEEGERIIAKKRETHAAPPEMMAFSAQAEGKADILVSVKEV
ncbi:MAG: NAD(P)/FAD-dependent oxidoreductase [Christensenellales bacterium]|jgi:NADPH-dependent 2,4-dienoyl-CoA reductase/sulfur reductase-like enzyme